MLARSRLRHRLPVAFVLGLALLGSACDGDSSNTPGGKNAADSGGKDGGAPKQGGKEYVYAADGFALTATTKVKLEITSSQGQGAAELSARSLIEAKPGAAGQLEVHGKVVELLGYEGSGQLDPEFMKKQAEEQGGEAIDIVEELRTSEAWMIVDHKGKTDEKATEAMAQNQGGDEGSPMNFGLFSLPDLPAVDLEVGKKIKLPTRADETQLPFGAVPVEVDETWTLRSLNGNIAELDVLIESSGAEEFDAGGSTGTVSVLEESGYTIFFDIETKLPVSFNGYSASEIALDMPQQQIQFSTNNEVETTFETGAPAAAPAATDAPAEDAAAEGADAAGS